MPTMASTESLIKMINARLKAIYGYFTEKSTEYMRAKSIIYSYYGQFDVLLREQEDKPLAISRSKRALEAFYSRPDELRDLWSQLQKLGTVKELASNYEFYPDDYSSEPEDIGANYKEEWIRDLIREETQEAYEAEYADDDLYEKLTDEIQEQAMIPPEERDYNYWTALNTAYELLHTRGMGVEQKVARAWGIFNEARLAHEEWLRQNTAESDQEYGLGSNV